MLQELERMDIATLIIWEHEVRPDPVPRALELAADVRARRARTHQTDFT